MKQKKSKSEESLTPRPDTLEGWPYTYSFRVSHIRTIASSDDIVDDEPPPINCGVCGSDNIICIYENYYSDLAGKSGTWEFLCLECRKYTILDLND